MRYLALATDYDGTLAHDGRVMPETVTALERLVETGRKLILVTGRELADLRRVFGRLDLFHRVVVENGAVLYDPAQDREVPLAEPPPAEFAKALRDRGVQPLSVGRVIVATWEPNETVVLDAIRELGLELKVTFNKGAVMVLPAGVTKASGLQAALEELRLSPHNVVGIGDAENDHAFLMACECAVAVANALPALKDACDLVTDGARGAGVAELAERLVADDLASLDGRLIRHDVTLGGRPDDAEVDVKVPPVRTDVLVAGPSGSGKSTVVTALLERLGEAGYQSCVVDPEGDYGEHQEAVHLGDPANPPAIEALLDVLENPHQSVVANLLGVRLDDRPAFLDKLLRELRRLRADTARPHRIAVDEAHHMLAAGEPNSATVPEELDGFIWVATHPSQLDRAVLDAVELVVVIGPDPAETIRPLCEAVGCAVPQIPAMPEDSDRVVAWWWRTDEPPFPVQVAYGRTERQRHVRKYAEGELGEDKSFYFRGPDDALNLRAQNLQLFIQLADGVDDRTWLHHLRRGDYSRWLREAIKDEDLADEIAAIERDPDPDSRQSRTRVREAIERQYTSPD